MKTSSRKWSDRGQIYPHTWNKNKVREAQVFQTVDTRPLRRVIPDRQETNEVSPPLAPASFWRASRIQGEQLGGPARTEWQGGRSWTGKKSQSTAHLQSSAEPWAASTWLQWTTKREGKPSERTKRTGQALDCDQPVSTRQNLWTPPKQTQFSESQGLERGRISPTLKKGF